jgi:cytochrome c oxidase assembly protein subunit 15
MDPGHSVWLHRFAVFAAVCVFPLIFIGGLVTSKGAGLAVPDWPNSYGYNMFLFPPSMWVGNILYEHSHRLFASFVGLLTTILAVWLWVREPRRWVRWLGVIAFFAVLFQGILGGLRVVMLKDEIGIFHACLAQAFFCYLAAIALFTSDWWKRTIPASDARAAALHKLAIVTTVIIFAQLALGATMRHSHAGLAIPDFPLAYGQLVPPGIAQINDRRAAMDLDPVTSGQVAIHFAHRLGAIVVSGAVLALAIMILRKCRDQAILARMAIVLIALLVIQFGLGAWTVLSGKAADVATMHVATGALLFAASFVVVLASHRLFAPLTQSTVLRPPSLAVS